MNDTGGENVYKKFQEKIIASTSTPNNITISSRKSIHPDQSVSPITSIRSNHAVTLSPPNEHSSKRQQRSKSEIHSNSDHSENSCDECDEDASPKSYSFESSSRSYLHESSYSLSNSSNRKKIYGTPPRSLNRSNQTSNVLNLGIIFSCLGIAAVSTLIAVGVSMISSENTAATINPVTIEELQDSFPRQSENLWSALETGIDEVKSFNKPSVFLLLYEAKAEQTVNFILKNMSKYAACVLKENCELEPIILTSTILGSEKARTDYGYIINKYKPELEERSVMIVKNLDKISGEVAQAFHSMCDEYTPLVQRAVFFFTIRVENLNRSDKTDLQMVEEVLKNNWSILDDDIFYPLFTRISNMVMRIMPEKI